MKYMIQYKKNKIMSSLVFDYSIEEDECTPVEKYLTLLTKKGWDPKDCELGLVDETEFNKFEKMSRLSRDCIITEKIDGTNAQITITEDGQFLTGSRNRWIKEGDDNKGFAKWCNENKEELMKLGVGTHYGEWWGQGIQRKYGISEKRFSLFNASRWSDDEVRPKCCHVVPILYEGMFSTNLVDLTLDQLKFNGSSAAPGFMSPEGIVIFHTHNQVLFKKTIKNDEVPKSKVR